MREGSLSKQRALVAIQTRARLNYDEGSPIHYAQMKTWDYSQPRITRIKRIFDFNFIEPSARR